MGKSQRIVTTVLWALAVFGMLGLVATGLWARRSTEARTVAQDHAAQLAASSSADADGALRVYFDAPHFKLIDQDNRTITDQTLRGSIWVAMVFFTNCPDICPGMMGRLVDLQQTVPHTDVKLVSFSIDPERDTPEQLKRYAERLDADSSRWHLLTGTKAEMFAAADGLKLAAAPATEDQPITHTGKMLLIDRAGKVRGVYDSADDESMEKLARDTVMLVSEKPQ